MINLVKKISIFSLFMSGVGVYAQDAAAVATAVAEKAPEASSTNPLFISMAVLTSVLLFVIVILSAVLRTSVKTKIRDIINAKSVQTVIAAIFIFGAQNTFAQAATEVKESMYVDTPIGGMHPMAFYSLFIVLLLELFVILWLCLMILRIIVKREAVSAVANNEKPAQSSFSLFISRKVFGVKPVETDKDVMLDHDYDGIKELDNDLPPWWKYGFYFTIISGLVYLVGYHVTGSFKSSEEEYTTEMAEAEASVAAYRNKMALNVDETNAVFATESDKLAKGGEIFVKNCLVCHGEKGQGGIGPNFADNYWIYGGKPGDLFKTVRDGTTKGMKSWKDELSPVDIQNVISYIHTFKGTNPANAKAAEGVLFEESTDTVGSDSTSVTKADSTTNIEVK